ncbi:hypothetical protein EAF04_002648 [Stromatinia cepivora]|nr:hypothetical protein EAF04_002648 [Stromatinia cepivora]
MVLTPPGTLIFFSIFSFLPLLLTSNGIPHSIILTRRANLSTNLPPPPSRFLFGAAKLKFLLKVTLPDQSTCLLPNPSSHSISPHSLVSLLLCRMFSRRYMDLMLKRLSSRECINVFSDRVLACNTYYYQPLVKKPHEKGRLWIVAPEYRLYPAEIIFSKDQ